MKGGGEGDLREVCEQITEVDMNLEETQAAQSRKQTIVDGADL